jgi:hypothetical protein
MYTFAEQYYSFSEWEGKVVAEGWSKRLNPCGIYSSVGIAEAEARLAFYDRHGVHIPD